MLHLVDGEELKKKVKVNLDENRFIDKKWKPIHVHSKSLPATPIGREIENREVVLGNTLDRGGSFYTKPNHLGGHKYLDYSTPLTRRGEKIKISVYS